MSFDWFFNYLLDMMAQSWMKKSLLLIYLQQGEVVPRAVSQMEGDKDIKATSRKIVAR